MGIFTRGATDRAKKTAAKNAAKKAAEKAAEKASSFAVDRAPKVTKKAERENMRSLSVFESPSVEPIVTQAGRLGLPIGGAEQMAFAHPRAHGSYSRIKPRTPESDFSATYGDVVNTGPRPVFSVDRLENNMVLPLYGDRTAAGMSIKTINGIPVDVPLYGGPRYPEVNAALGSAAGWASEKAPIGALRSKIRSGLDAGKDVYGVYTAMGPTSADQSDMMVNALLQQIQSSPILKKDLAVFNKEARSYLPGFAGVEHPDAYQQLLGQTQGKRKRFVRQMDNAKRLAEGFPDASSARLAITEEALRGTPAGASGYSVVKFGPESLEQLEPTLVHPTYSVQIAGKPMGALENQVPFDMLYPDFFNARRAARDPGGSDLRALELSKPTQNMRAQDIDRLAKYLETIKQGR